MKKLLATSLIASVAVASVEASDSCVNGGFYIQGGFGLSMTKMKYKNSLKPQFNVLIKEELYKMQLCAVNNIGNKIADVYRLADLLNGRTTTDATKTSFNRRKGLFAFQFGGGFDKRIHSVMIGVDFNFGKNFGKVNKKETGLALTDNYSTLSNIEITKPQDMDNFHEVDDNIVRHGSGIYHHDAKIGDDNDCVRSDKIDAHLYARDLELELQCKNKYYISIMPRIGILMNPRLELYVTAGVKIKSDKYTLTAVADKKSLNKTVTKCIPSFGLGLQYNFQNGMFTNLSYTFNLKAKKTFKFKANNKLNLDSTVKHTLQNSSHDVKLGIGYRF